jgi:hypothetical protein
MLNVTSLNLIYVVDVAAVVAAVVVALRCRCDCVKAVGVCERM